MEDSVQSPPTTPPKSQNDSMMEKLAALLSGQANAPVRPAEMLVPDYVGLWKKSLFEGRKCMELYDSDSKFKKPVLSREDFARMIFLDLLDRQRRQDFKVNA